MNFFFNHNIWYSIAGQTCSTHYIPQQTLLSEIWTIFLPFLSNTIGLFSLLENDWSLRILKHFLNYESLHPHISDNIGQIPSRILSLFQMTFYINNELCTHYFHLKKNHSTPHLLNKLPGVCLDHIQQARAALFFFCFFFKSLGWSWDFFRTLTPR